jgi:hypothetical protein
MNDRGFVIQPGAALTLDATGAAPPSVANFAFVTNVSRLDQETNFTLAPGHELRRANAAEITSIKETLNRQMPDLAMFNPWEFQAEPGGSIVLLPETEWKYFVISFQGSNSTVAEIEEALLLAPLEIRVGFTAIQWKGASQGVVIHPERLFQKLYAARRWQEQTLLEVTPRDVEEIVKLLAQLKQHDNALVPVKQITAGLADLDALPLHSPTLFLGYFALLESLLTHQPRPNDTLDSITRQIKKKVALLDKRFQHSLDYSSFAAPSDKIWGCMYEYRSSLAHGKPRSGDGKLEILGNHGNALQLVKQTVKAVTRQALIEPQLLADLRNC